jgi:ParB family transcriptional regulator, chromosome partitioning protein
MKKLTGELQLLSIDSIEIINPRKRSRRVFKDVVSSIADVGLKRPITVARRDDIDGTKYDLICGQGRLEAYKALGQTEIPAVVVDVSNDDCLVMSLVENIARRHRPAIDHLREIERLQGQGYTDEEISLKTGMTADHVRGLLKLLKEGEFRLLSAVDNGLVPVSIAMQIASNDDAEVQRILQEAYEKRVLRGRKFLAAKLLVTRRQRSGKGYASLKPQRVQSVDRLLQIYKEDSDKKLLMVRKAESTRDRLLFAIEALRKLLSDDHFVTLLRAERLDTVPKNIATRLQASLH